jgi:hypothetical protein
MDVGSKSNAGAITEAVAGVKKRPASLLEQAPRFPAAEPVGYPD